MKLLICGLNFSPELTGIGKYSGEMAAWLAQQGHKVRVVSAPPYYPGWKVADNYSAWRYKKESSAGVTVWRCPLYVPPRPSGLKRLLHLASFALSSLPVMLRQIFWKPDVIILIEPPLVCSPGTLFAAMLCNACTWLHIQDLEVDAAFNLGILKSYRMRKFALWIERWLMSGFDRISSISPNMIRRLHLKGVSEGKTVLFPNWVDPEAIFPMEGNSPMRDELEIQSDKIVVLYSGNMGEKQGLEIVLEAARDTKDESVLFVLCGEGAARQRLQTDYGSLPNVMWLPLQPVDRLNDLLNMADIHLLPQRADAADLVMPSKLTGMLASGRPVIATAPEGSQIAEVVETCGLVTAPGNASQFMEAILRLASDGSLRATLGSSARKYAVEHLARDAILGKFVESLQECLSEP